MATLRWRGTRAQLTAALRSLPAVLAGRAPDPHGLHAIFWGYVGNAVLGEIRGAYLTKATGGVGSDGIAWPDLALATLQKRRRAGRTDSDILLETGRLLQSLRPGPDELPSLHPDQVFKIDARGVTVGTDAEYADFHQYGTPHMPPRAIVPPNGELPDAWVEPVERAMEVALQKVIEVLIAAGPTP